MPKHGSTTMMMMMLMMTPGEVSLELNCHTCHAQNDNHGASKRILHLGMLRQEKCTKKTATPSRFTTSLNFFNGKRRTVLVAGLAVKTHGSFVGEWVDTGAGRMGRLLLQLHVLCCQIHMACDYNSDVLYLQFGPSLASIGQSWMLARP